ncbi:alanine racemase [Oscillospiraceae bacterium OttesenSCG-928-F05]|nr:alanine racemase [Oscillospiraceae bacterium OttesenSCG-928-F05]
MKALVVEKARVRANVEKIRSRAGDAVVYAVLKGGAYGLGLLEMAEVLVGEGITHFALTETDDAVKLRKAGFSEQEILILCSTTDDRAIEALCEYNLVGTIGSHDAAVAANGVADRLHTVVECHIEVDTGMGRYGFLPSEFDKIVSVYKYMPNVALTGMYTHFYRAYDSEKTTRRQLGAFLSVVERLRAGGIEPGMLHAANSSALFRYDFCGLDAVRVGSALTGRLAGGMTFGLERVGYIQSAITETRWLRKGDTIGYGGCYTAKKPMRIAVVPVGYVDGFCAEKSRDSYKAGETLRYILSELKKGIFRKKLYVRVGKAKARVIGHVGMLHTVCDVTGIDCAAGDEVRLDLSPLFAGEMPRTYL